MDTQVSKEQIQNALKAFVSGNLRDNARRLFNALGYRSERRIDLSPNTSKAFLEAFDQKKQLNAKAALLEHWRSIDLLFQLTTDEVNQIMQGQLAFSGGRVDNTIIESYLFFAVDLTSDQYTRTQFADITREINKLFDMPVMVLFRHGDCLTLAIINRRLHRRDESRDVLEKVTLIKDIRFASPHRAHIEILLDLSFDALYNRHAFTNFVALHTAWQNTLDTSVLNQKFYQELANWYFWALDHVTFPKDAPKDRDDCDSISLIRMVTRLIFCWFLKEKGLIPDDLFHEQKVRALLIENCLYGVDIQPIAVQIAKLRCFISLVVEQEPDDKLLNLGILPLPNLETKFIAANTLFGLHRHGQMTLVAHGIEAKQTELRDIRHEHFLARRYSEKKALRKRDKKLREELAELLKSSQSFSGPEAVMVADWDPYHADSSAAFFDPEWMFSLAPRRFQRSPGTWRGNLSLINEASGQMELVSSRPITGFDIVIGNPPYVRQEELKKRKAFEGLPGLEGR